MTETWKKLEAPQFEMWERVAKGVLRSIENMRYVADIVSRQLPRPSTNSGTKLFWAGPDGTLEIRTRRNGAVTLFAIGPEGEYHKQLTGLEGLTEAVNDARQVCKI